MAVRSLNKVQLIGNLTRDPNLRFTPNGAAVCSFGVATNRSWTTDGGDREERVEFHNIVAWSKLAEICGQLLGKGDKVYVEGRLQTREWKGDDDVSRRTTEVVIDNMILLKSQTGKVSDDDMPDDGYMDALDGDEDDGGDSGKSSKSSKPAQKSSSKSSSSSKKSSKTSDDDGDDDDDIADDVPF